jgi:2-polyprenyl-6-hydroxyphenyl methylase/3-demethylubiquinone-9 3-methyltransferase
LQAAARRISDAMPRFTVRRGRDRVPGSTFLDAGSRSGLFSLATVRLGARRVHSFDFDPDGGRCTEELRRWFFRTAGHWTIERGSAVDAEYIGRRGQSDIVYSWGVLHRTTCERWRGLLVDLVRRRNPLNRYQVYRTMRAGK